MVLRSDSTRIADRDLGRPVDAGGESRADPATPEWLPFTFNESCSSNGMSVGIRKPDLYFSTVSRESCNAKSTNMHSETDQRRSYSGFTVSLHTAVTAEVHTDHTVFHCVSFVWFLRHRFDLVALANYCCGLFTRNEGFGAKWGKGGAMFTPTNSFLLLGFLTSVLILVTIHQET